jgi:uncharacterized protein (DUF1684 family)
MTFRDLVTQSKGRVQLMPISNRTEYQADIQAMRYLDVDKLTQQSGRFESGM